jgi:hypothetical protein
MIAANQRRSLELHLAWLWDQLNALPPQSPRRGDLIRRVRDTEDALDAIDAGEAT